jgi:hypothetical protein
MKRNVFFSRVWYFLSAVVLVALASSRPAFTAEIHDAAARGDVERVKALLQDNPALVLNTTPAGWTPLHFAVASGHSDVSPKSYVENPSVISADASPNRMLG